MAHSKTDPILIMTKFAGLKGTCELIRKQRDELQDRFSESFLDSVLSLEGLLTENKEPKTVQRYKDADLYEGGKTGIFAALWEFSEKLQKGLSVDIRKIPLRQETIETANYLDVNPYEISSEGVFLIAINREDAEKILAEFKDSGINADVIGEFNEGNDRVLINRGARRFLTPVSRIEDEIRLRNSQKNV